MFEDSVATIPSIWASMNSWFTPAVLFVLLNVMIGTIAFTSTLANQNKHHHQNQNQSQQQQQQHNLQEHSQNNLNKLARSPSLLQRVRSINFYSYRSQEPNLVTTTANNTSANLNFTPNTTTHFKISPDSNTLYDFEHTHQSETLENPSNYMFDQPHQESQPDETHMQYNLFHQNLQESVEETNTHYFFEQNHEEKAEEIVSQFQFEQQNEQESEVQFEKEAFEGGEDDDELQSLDEVYSKLTGSHMSRTKSDTEPASGEVPAKLPAKMRKSASMKSAFGHFEVEDIVETRRPATVRERGVAKVTEADEGVDAKADDFINKFKQQLKLQRIDSLVRYKEMITRGSGK